MSFISQPAVIGAIIAGAAFATVLIFVSIEDALKH